MSDNPNPPTPGFAIQARAIRKNFGFLQALKGIDLDIKKGEFLTLFGPNGAGKTTLIKILSALAKPTSGQAYVAGYNVLQANPELRRQIGVISHVSCLYLNLTAIENMVFYAKMYNLEHPEERAVQVIDEVGLKPRMNDRVGTFSRGMSQRLSIARAIIHDPSVLFLDEPFSGLDQHASKNLKDHLHSLHTGDRTVLMTTHDLTLGLEMCDKAAILVRGQLGLMEHVDNIDKNNFEKQYFEIVANQAA